MAYHNIVELTEVIKDYTDRGDSAQEALTKSAVGWAGKNEIPVKFASQEINGVTITVDADGVITANGTASGNISIWTPDFYVENKNYTLTGTTNATNNKQLQVYAHIGSTDFGEPHINEASGSGLLSSTNPVRVRLYIASGTVLDNEKFYPMLRDANIKDSTFEPHHESVEETLRDAEVVEGKNLLHISNDVVSQTINGGEITANRNTNGEVTEIILNGTFNALTNIDLLDSNITVPSASIISGCAANGSSSTYLIQLTDGTNWISDYGNSNNVPAGTYTRVLIQIKANQTVSNVKFYPMICTLEEWNKSHAYAPYYVPVKDRVQELTDVAKGIGIIRTLTSSDDLDDLRNDLSGLYYVTTSAANSPEGINYYMLLNAVQSSNNDAKQVAFNATGTGCGIYVRSMGLNATWTNWYKFSGTKLT